MPCYADNRPSSVDEMWTAKKPEMKSRRTLPAPCRASKNAFTVGNRHHPEVTEGTRVAPGNRRVARMAGTGGPFGYPVVAAFLELPLEFGVRGPVRLVPFPVGLYGAVVRLGERLLGLL